jgi:sulfoxide reductase heme-binding subunit YedZ
MMGALAGCDARRWSRSMVNPCKRSATRHYLWPVKKDLTQPLIYAAILVLLLGLRLQHARRQARAPVV